MEAVALQDLLSPFQEYTQDMSVIPPLRLFPIYSRLLKEPGILINIYYRERNSDFPVAQITDTAVSNASYPCQLHSTWSRELI